MSKGKTLIIGNGYLGQRFRDFLGEDAVIFRGRIDSISDAQHVLSSYSPKPAWVLNAAGHTGKPNVDACEKEKAKTLSGNVHLPIFLAQSCSQASIRFAHLSSGCIYDGYQREFTEGNRPNFDGSLYSATKATAEKLLTELYPDSLILRLRIPLDDRNDPRNIINKLLNFVTSGVKILDTPNSITYVPDLLEITKQLMENYESGIFNVVNKGSMTHPELLDIYQRQSGQHLDYKTCTREDLELRTIARRSNCCLSVSKLESIGIDVRPVKKAMELAVKNYLKQES